jgi:hypothetical protein
MLNTIEAEEKMKKHNYKLDGELSNIQTKVFYNPEADNPLLITYRGTNSAGGRYRHFTGRIRASRRNR